MSIALIAYKCVSSINSSTDRIIEVINTERLEYPKILNDDWLKEQSKRIGDAINENYANPEFKKFNVTNATFKCELVTILSVTKIEETNVQEQYPTNWKHCTIHLNPDTGEMHSDGDHSVREWIQNKIK